MKNINPNMSTFRFQLLEWFKYFDNSNRNDRISGYRLGLHIYNRNGKKLNDLERFYILKEKIIYSIFYAILALAFLYFIINIYLNPDPLNLIAILTASALFTVGLIFLYGKDQLDNLRDTQLFFDFISSPDNYKAFINLDLVDEEKTKNFSNHFIDRTLFPTSISDLEEEQSINNNSDLLSLTKEEKKELSSIKQSSDTVFKLLFTFETLFRSSILTDSITNKKIDSLQKFLDLKITTGDDQIKFLGGALGKDPSTIRESLKRINNIDTELHRNGFWHQQKKFIIPISQASENLLTSKLLDQIKEKRINEIVDKDY
ncbi:hypothetical protein Belba_2154 [Belliella baltica DSM 15883]|uniref:Uncharacterized protein n=1 Tax=Belliella baltica (strain DSM 15883 / CIP 108006 / LMG 21964 / BA134) TaxID=866536 RepID=I3Z653_BELBD|nr:hypothetical protein [Belliella baltica]AFL84721.1 hypothetical protein Belba_2154 [Belliella baltica DSM 15883]